MTLLEDGVENLRELRAGRAGHLALRAAYLDMDADPLTAPSRTWESATLYRACRHRKKVGGSEALAMDLRAECVKVGLPTPLVTPLELRGVPGIGLVGRARLEFRISVSGPTPR